MTDSSTDLAVLTYRKTTTSFKRLADRRRVAVKDLTHLLRVPKRNAPALTVFVSFVADIDDAAIKHLRRIASAIQRYFLVSEHGRVEAIAERVARLNIRSPGRLHIASLEEGESSDRMWRRFLSVLSAPTTEQRILDAWWEDHEFVVLSQNFQRLHLSLDQLQQLEFFAESNRAKLERFVIDEDGSFIQWPQLDVDLDWSGFCRLAGKEDARRQAQLRRFRTEYGAAIRQLRERDGLRQKDVKGLDERHVRRIEKGEISATPSALKKLAASHGMSLQDYLDELAKLVKGELTGPR